MKYIATIGEDQERSGRGESWKEKETFDSMEKARAFVVEKMSDVIGFRLESGETNVKNTKGFAKHMEADDIKNGTTLEELEEFLDELDGLDGEDFSFFWSIKEVKDL